MKSPAETTASRKNGLRDCTGSDMKSINEERETVQHGGEARLYAAPGHAASVPERNHPIQWGPRSERSGGFREQMKATSGHHRSPPTRGRHGVGGERAAGLRPTDL